jgi:toxin ParE1/3/4
MEAIGDYIGADNPQRAVSFVQELHEQCRRIAQNPLGYQPRPELAANLRSYAYGRYVIFFEVTSEEVAIIRVLHGARDLPAVFRDDVH